MKPEWRTAERRIYNAKQGLRSLRYARNHFISDEAMNQPGSPRTLERVRKAIVSAEGAVRNAIDHASRIGWHDGIMPCQSPWHENGSRIFLICPQCGGARSNPGIHRS